MFSFIVTTLVLAGGLGLGLAWARRVHDTRELLRLHGSVPEAARHDHALVIGGSWTGLLTAAVLARYFRKVTILERDVVLSDLYSDDPPGPYHPSRRSRAGAPHAAQLHQLGPFGVAFVEALFPTFPALLRAHGGRRAERGARTSWFHHGAWRPRQRLDQPMWFASRPLLEWAVRKLVVETFTNVFIEERVRVLGLVGNGKGAISGVNLVRVGVSDGTNPCIASEDTQFLTADFVADCGGKTSRSGMWLAQLGYPRARTERVEPRVQYSSRAYSRPAAAVARQGDFGWLVGAGGGEPGGRIAGAVTTEDDRLVLWSAVFGGSAPQSDHEFTQLLRTLETPYLAHLLEGPDAATPAPGTALHVYSAGPMLRRQYERLRRFPDNYVILGDAACCTEPLFGLGLSLAAAGVSALNEALQQHTRRGGGRPPSFAGFGKAFTRRLAWRTLFPWLLTTLEDYRHAGTEGPLARHPAIRALQWYVDKVLDLTHRDPTADATVMGVTGLWDHPLRLVGPRMLGALARDAWSSRASKAVDLAHAVDPG
jgi:2-polyprenyl-6-methoxyphenol hydroxylase-like FAD-dependent oxidoreductase